MKILLYADFRSPHAQGWLIGAQSTGMDVVALSSHYVDLPAVIAPTSRIARARQRGAVASKGGDNGRVNAALATLAEKQTAHTLMELAGFTEKRQMLKRAVAAHRPDLLHALRVPYEGLVALSAIKHLPIAVSSWGLDFHLQAANDPVLRWWMRRVLPRVAGFAADAENDLAEAMRYGVPASVPTIVAAGNFGVPADSLPRSGKGNSKTVLCLRRPAENVRIDVFLAAVAELSTSGLEFILVGGERLRGNDAREASKLEATGVLAVLPSLARRDFLDLVASACLVVSPAIWDGTPNTVLEALAINVPVIAGDLPQLRQLERRGHLDLVDLCKGSELSRAIETSVAEANRGGAMVRSEGYELPEWARFEPNIGRVAEFYKECLT